MLTRNVQMNIRVTPEEKKLFEQAATQCGLTLSQYIRMRLRNQIPRQLPTTDYPPRPATRKCGSPDGSSWGCGRRHSPPGYGCKTNLGNRREYRFACWH